MDVSKLVLDYEKVLESLAKTPYFGNAAITHYLSKPELKVICPPKIVPV